MKESLSDNVHLHIPIQVKTINLILSGSCLSMVHCRQSMAEVLQFFPLLPYKLFRSESLPYAHSFLHLSNYISCKICANARKNKKDTQEWKPLKCLISKLLRFVAGPGIEPGTS